MRMYTNVECNSFLCVVDLRVLSSLLRDDTRRWKQFPVVTTLIRQFCRHVHYVVKVDSFVDRTEEPLVSGPAVSGRLERVVDMVVRWDSAPATAVDVTVNTSSTMTLLLCHKAAVWSPVLLVPVFFISDVMTGDDKAVGVC